VFRGDISGALHRFEPIEDDGPASRVSARRSILCPMLRIRRDADIHDVEGGWFRARWHFSFDDYSDPENDSFGAMRVFNDDRLVPGAVWPLHPHRDVEGLTYVVEGTFGHEDNIGGPFGPLEAGSVQRMTLGSGAWHSELNASKTEPMRFIQIWILPDTPSLPPGVEQRAFTRDDRSNRLLRVFAPMGEAGEGSGAAHGQDAADGHGSADGHDSADGLGPVGVHQDASIFVASLDAGVEVRHVLGDGRGAYLYVIDGRLTLGGGAGEETDGDPDALGSGDAAKVTDVPGLTIRAGAPSELILVDVPMRFEPVGIWRGRS
jgi:redox-sensitive bicupin YhaK (pirin superfamily)